MIRLIKKALGLFGVGNPSITGPVVSGKKEGESVVSYIPFSKGSGKDAVIATEQFAMPRTGAKMDAPLSLNGITPANRVWVSMYTSGTGHRDAPTALDQSSQYIVVGGREYGANSVRGIGFGYVGNINEIAPVFAGMREVGPDDHTNGDFIVATRSSMKNVPLDVRFSVTASGQIVAYEGYVPTGKDSLVSKSYLDKLVSDLKAELQGKQ